MTPASGGAIPVARGDDVQVAEAEGARNLSVELTADITSAYVSNNVLAASELPSLIASIFGALTSAGASKEEPAVPQRPAVPIKKSITPEHLICLEDGLRFRAMKRHLRSKYGLTPEAYRAKWGLPSDYPMVAPAYSQSRASMAKEWGFGQGGRRVAGAKAPPPKAASKAVRKNG
jgi:predicted transcriptional regulator